MINRVLILFLFVFLFVNITFACDFSVDIDQGYFKDGKINGDTVKPGDEICIKAGNRGYLKFIDFHGTKQAPIVIKNKGGLVSIDTEHSYGFALSDCSYIKIRGDGDNDYKYGIKVRAPNAGHVVSIGDGSTDVEVSNLEIYGHNYNESYSALGAKTDPQCGSDFVRGKFQMNNIIVHDNYIHDINQGFYFGWTFFTKEIDCNGKIIRGHTMQGVKIYNNLIERVGQDGMQVSSATSTDGKCEIYGNILKDTSLKNLINQRSAITIGGGSKCDVYNNISINSNGPGVLFLGYAGKIYNNLIVNAGKKGEKVDAIFLDHRSGNDYENGSIDILSNTIVDPARNGIRFYNKYLINNNIHDNLIVSPGFVAHKNHWSWKENGQYIYLEKGRINREEINDGKSILDYLFVGDIKGKTVGLDNLGLDVLSKDSIEKMKSVTSFGVRGYSNILNITSTSTFKSKADIGVDLKNSSKIIGGSLLGFYFPTRKDLIMVDMIVDLLNKKYARKKNAIKKGLRSVLIKDKITLRLNWIIREILKNI